MDTRRSFIKKASLLGGGASFLRILPESIQKALSIDPAPGSTFWDAEHIVLLMQENRSFDHTYGTLQGVRGYNDPRAIQLPNLNKVWLQSNKEGQTFAPFRLDMQGTKATWMSSLPHSWANQVDARNQGKFDGWLDAKHSGHEAYAAMPLTMGYYTREDIPFYYSLADAFTVCDQHFCSSLTGTTPNRLYFWTGTIREKPEASARANVWNEDTDYEAWANWTTFPERLEENGISWKVYQNELSVGVGFEGEEDSWLGNFTDNPLEFFRQFHVKFSPEYIANLPHAAEWLTNEIKKQEALLQPLPADSKKAIEIKNYIAELKKYQEINARDQQIYTREKYEALSAREKSIHQKAFSTNRGDASYHQLSTLKYQDGNEQRELLVPKGDILHQFREDVKNSQLPTVSWLVAPENFSDHPSSAWFGAWYISEVMDILTQNPEVWKKTIFILTYDENDGYFDHVPPFVAPSPYQPGSGKVSEGIQTDIEFVRKQEQSIADHARESSIGLGYRVPMVVASPWSRGGWVCSEVFDHTSPLQFLEKFLSRKTNKEIKEPNISDWRRTICGDLGSAFRPWNGEKINLPPFIERDPFLESIHKAKFKNVPSDFKALTPEDIAIANTHSHASPYLPTQEKGIRSSCALPYELYVDGQLNADKKTFAISFHASDRIFGKDAAGSPFQVYAPGKYLQESVRTWSYSVKAGFELKDQWPLADFENGAYHLRVYGPNGFYREFMGDAHDPSLDVLCRYQLQQGQKPTGHIELLVTNGEAHLISVAVTDNAYHAETRMTAIPAGPAPIKIVIDLSKSHGWYDFSIKIAGLEKFEKRFAGRVETGLPSKTDPLMGGV
jgi:phospholipase C